ncbi:uncharacterized protein LOC144429910 [Styela clava]
MKSFIIISCVIWSLLSGVLPAPTKYHRHMLLEDSMEWLEEHCDLKRNPSRIFNTFAPYELRIWQCLHYPRNVEVVNCYNFCHNPLTRRTLYNFEMRMSTTRVSLVNPSKSCHHVTLTIPTRCECRMRR